jgi:anti-sigma regulatory factor (Ser/Thr protein kinase)
MTASLRSSFRHEAVSFSGPDAFGRLVTTLLGAGMRAGEACALLATAPRINAARSALGTDARRVSFVDMSVAGRNPARVLPAMQHLVDSHPGQRLCWLAVPVERDARPAVAAEVAVHESLLAVPPVTAWDGRLRCLYDPDEVGIAAVADIKNRHRALAADAAAAALGRALSEPLPAPPADAETRPVDLTTLTDLRQFVRDRAAIAGLPVERTDDLVYAVNEVVTNSICHGEGRARVTFWAEGGVIICEVHDRGRIRDPLAGRVAPKPGQLSGRGLWLVNHLCDLVQLRSSEWGTVVRMHVDT